MTASRHLETLCLLFHNVVPVKNKITLYNAHCIFYIFDTFFPFQSLKRYLLSIELGVRRKTQCLGYELTIMKKINYIIIVILDSGMKKRRI